MGNGPKFEETTRRMFLIRRTIAWEQSNPPTTIDPQQFNYDAEDAALASGA